MKIVLSIYWNFQPTPRLSISQVRDEKEYAKYLDLLRTEGMLVYQSLKKDMEQNDLNPDYLDTPNKVQGLPQIVREQHVHRLTCNPQSFSLEVLPGQPGVRDEQTTVRHFSPGQDCVPGGMSLCAFEYACAIARACVLELHRSQLESHTSLGLRYCLDTAEITNENRLFRGSYETTYVVPSLGLKAVCMSCARR